jgi:hypothetical protein
MRNQLFYCEKEPEKLVSWEEDCKNCQEECLIQNAKNTKKKSVQTKLM